MSRIPVELWTLCKQFSGLDNRATMAETSAHHSCYASGRAHRRSENFDPARILDDVLGGIALSTLNRKGSDFSVEGKS